MSEQAPENYIGIEEAAAFLNVSVITLRNWLKREDVRIPAHKIGRLWKFKKNRVGSMGQERRKRQYMTCYQLRVGMDQTDF